MNLQPSGNSHVTKKFFEMEPDMLLHIAVIKLVESVIYNACPLAPIPK